MLMVLLPNQQSMRVIKARIQKNLDLSQTVKQKTRSDASRGAISTNLIIEVDGCMLHYRLLSPATEASSSADGFDQMVAAWEEALERKL